ncbi:MAG: hypothetical protein COZ37_01640 [bacterium (Candidatus Ratteibacteria) CG_4_10_14_3_um_filter_41_18]|uniref:Uncharacterized protein n=1 Tax=bacterium (Candidatus Ratteibacteria) CG_4_10_14_3_um_filter_41_18 TaxID=2014287 RepID=A0A2M7M4L9_9BACT|nr:MAG: hypothetical protein COZ37_01640 [bacterium (Candidatus Ratteibacteria) CG_4_10_14_3_um_filter_41_18]
MIYRNLVNASDLKSFKLIIKESNLFILFAPNSSKIPENLKDIAGHSLLNCRRQIEDYIKNYPSFQESYIPVKVGKGSPLIVREMAEASSLVNVGPMAAVAGAVAEFVGKEILKFSDEVIVENGGDIFLKSNKRRRVAIYAGEDSPFSRKIALEINPETTPVGICCSSGTLGHSYSFGKADGSVAVAVSTALADASATAIGNLIQIKSDLSKGVEFAKKIPGLLGTVIIKEDKIAIWGKIKIVEL